MPHLFTRRFTALMPGLAAACAMLPIVLGARLDAQAPSLQKEVRTREVYVSAVDRRGAPVADLGPADFSIREDGAVREVLTARPADEPLQVAVLIDDSQAAMEATSYLREGLVGFLERLHGKGEVGLITIGERPTVVAPYSSDTEELKQRANRIFPRSGTGAYLGDAILDASRALAKRQARRAIIVAVTFEGIDYSNRYHQQVLDELKKSGVALHVIAVGTPAESSSDEMRSRNLVIAEGTARTGGRRDQVLALSGLPDKLKQAADELTHQYVVSYNRPVTLIPPNKIEVGTTKRNVTVRARTWLGDS